LAYEELRAGIMPAMDNGRIQIQADEERVMRSKLVLESEFIRYSTYQIRQLCEEWFGQAEKGVVKYKRSDCRDRRRRFLLHCESEECAVVLLEAWQRVQNKRGCRLRPDVRYLDRQQARQDLHQVPAAVEEKKPLRIVSWNMNSYKVKKGILEEVCKLTSADVVLLQETLRNEKTWPVRLGGFNVIESKSQRYVPGARGVALGLKSTLPYYMLSQNAYWIFVRIPLPNRAWIVGCVYLSAHGVLRARQKNMLKAVLAELRGKYEHDGFIIGGDLNMNENDASMALSGDGGMVRIKMLKPGPTRVACKNGKVITSCLDHLLVRDGCQDHVTPVKVWNRFTDSDHLPIQTTLWYSTEREARERQENRLIMNRCQVINKLKEIALSNRWAVFAETLEEKSVDQGFNDLLETVDEVAKDLELIVDPKDKKGAHLVREHRLSKETRKLIRMKRKLEHQMRREENENERASLKARLKTAKKEASRAVSMDQKVQWGIKVKEIVKEAESGNHKIVWQGLKRWIAGKRTYLPTQPICNSDGELVFSSDEILQVWQKHYANLLKDDTGHSKDRQFWEERISQEICPARAQMADLDQTITWAEMRQVLKAARNGKAPGMDGVIPEFYKAALHLDADHKEEPSNPFGKSLLTIAQKVFESGIVPEQAQTSVVVSIPKKGDLTMVDNYRGISLISVALKLVSTIVTRRVAKAIDERQVLVRAQAGFRSREECVAQVTALLEIIQRRQSVDKDTYVCFIDFKKAFDLVPHEALLLKLERLGVMGKCLGFIKSTYANSFVSVRIRGAGESDKVRVERGVRQGCPMSPLLFSIFINDIFDECGELGVTVQGVNEKISGLLFADDAVVLSESSEGLQSMLDRISSWADRWEMRVGHLKCGVMHFQSDNDEEDQVESYTLQGGAVPVVDSYTYLGVKFCLKDIERNMVIKRVENMQKALMGMHQFLRTQSIPLYLRRQVFRAMVIPVGTYGAEVFGMDSLRARLLQKVVNMGMRLLLGYSMKSTSASTACMCSELRLPLMEAYIAAMRVRAILKYPTLKTYCGLLMQNSGKGIVSWWTMGKRWMKTTNTSCNKARNPLRVDENASHYAKCRAWLARIQIRALQTKVLAGTKSFKRYRKYHFQVTAGVERWGLKYPQFAKGLGLVSKLRLNTLMNWKRLRNMRAVQSDDDTCPFCNTLPCTDSLYDMLVKCPKWSQYRDKWYTGLIQEYEVGWNRFNVTDPEERVANLAGGWAKAGSEYLAQKFRDRRGARLSESHEEKQPDGLGLLDWWVVGDEDVENESDEDADLQVPSPEGEEAESSSSDSSMSDSQEREQLEPALPVGDPSEVAGAGIPGFLILAQFLQRIITQRQVVFARIMEAGEVVEGDVPPSANAANAVGLEPERRRIEHEEELLLLQEDRP
jgi:exonuclease III